MERPVLELAALQAASAVYDGYTTSRPGIHENNPVVRVIVGRTPDWRRMVPLGAAEVIGTAWMAERFRQSEHLRKVWWLPQVSATVSHGVAGSVNWRL